MENKANQIAGTPNSMVPEQADGMLPTQASDVFSFGLILHELLTGKRAFEETNILTVLKMIRTIEPEEFALRLGMPFRSLLLEMLVCDPNRRSITMHEIYEKLVGA